jgi:enamine deaminase RidA (YjgF/YER057c/UK114 family)
MSGCGVEGRNRCVREGVVGVVGERSRNRGDSATQPPDHLHVSLQYGWRRRVEDDPEVARCTVGRIDDLPAGEDALAARVGEVETGSSGLEAPSFGGRKLFPRLHGTSINGAMSQLTHHDPAGLHRHPAFSQAVEIASGARLVLVGGQNGTDGSGAVVGATVAEQTRQALNNVRLAVEAAGGSVHDIARWRILLTDPAATAEGFAQFTAFWDSATPPPVVTVEIITALARPEFLVEIEATAALTPT